MGEWRVCDVTFSRIHSYFIMIRPWTVCLFHFTTSNKTPPTSQHIRGILPSEWEVQGTPCCCQLEKEPPRQGIPPEIHSDSRVLFLYLVWSLQHFNHCCKVVRRCFSSLLPLMWEKTLLSSTARTADFCRNLKCALWDGDKVPS